MNKKLPKSWILLLGKEYLSTKEQFNGLEAIGTIVKEDDDNTTPMDEDSSSDDKDTNTTTTSSEPETDSEPETETDSEPETDDDKGETPESDEVDEGGEELSSDTDEDIDDTSNTNDETGDEDSSTSPGNEKDISKDPNFIQNRRMLLSTKLLNLYSSIRDSIEIIVNGPPFPNKPVVLEEMDKLSDIVDAINKSVNKESDHKVLLLKYALCVKSYNRIMSVI